MKILIGVVIAAFVVIVGFLAIDPNLPQNRPPEISEPVDPGHVLSMTIEGQVEKPGTYALNEGATMKDLLDAAGGVTANADLRAFNETALLNKGSTYYIAPLFNDDDVCATEEITKVNINTDNANTLMTINGFTSSIAESIIDYRTNNGEFLTIEGLEDVYGIGPATYHKVRNFVILHA